MNIEDYREYCLSLGTDVEEKLPFTMFKSGENVLVFYVCGHMFAFFDCADYSVVTLKCQPERIDELKAEYDCIGKPYSDSGTFHWDVSDPRLLLNVSDAIEGMSELSVETLNTLTK